MLIREGNARTDAIDRRLAGILAAIAGALNAAAFHEVGFFSANMTGNVSASSDRFASTHWGAGLFYLCIVGAFIAGAFVSALFIHEGRRRAIRSIYALNIFLEGALMGALAWGVLELPLAIRTSLLVMGLSFLMGLQNAVVSTISGTRVRTTHISGMATDVGIELASLVLCLVGRGDEVDAVYAAKLRLHLHTIVAFFLGGIGGILIYEDIGMRMLFVAAIVLMALSLISMFGANHRTPEGARPA